MMLFTRVCILRDVPNEVYQNLNAVGGDEKWWEVIYFEFFSLFPLFEIHEVSYNQERCIKVDLWLHCSNCRLWSCKSLFWLIIVSNH
jgi:hypothetical protein